MSDSQLATTETKSIEFVPFGAAESIKLSVSIVQRLIAVPTKSGKLPDDKDCIKFMMLCKARHLNPFEGDAFLLGYDTQNGPQFSLITAHQVFLKRSEASDKFDGMESGVIVTNSDGEFLEREGDFTFQGETLLGGWSKVYRKDRKIPIYRRLKLATFSTGRSRWAADAAGMIVKCAEADALRSSFPTHLGGLYMREETNFIDVQEIPTAKIGIKQATPLDVIEDRKLAHSQLDEASAKPRPKKEAKAAPVAEEAPQQPPSEPEDYQEGGDDEPPASETPPAEDPCPALQAKIAGLRGPLNLSAQVLNTWLYDLSILQPTDDFRTEDAPKLREIVARWPEVQAAVSARSK